eukprot:TRINITY_DN40526_c0_g1_i1.p1 TRINITY_DN40526_c0_g1~~TRINITY_DN40526_c0_g1_i1.p1  ORF type:complete len:907 (+),score=187.75 TRINITY_DN40526_c0_g1_i1:240-2960(+)
MTRMAPDETRHLMGPAGSGAAYAISCKTQRDAFDLLGFEGCGVRSSASASAASGRTRSRHLRSTAASTLGGDSVGFSCFQETAWEQAAPRAFVEWQYRCTPRGARRSSREGRQPSQSDLSRRYDAGALPRPPKTAKPPGVRPRAAVPRSCSGRQASSSAAEGVRRCAQARHAPPRAVPPSQALRPAECQGNTTPPQMRSPTPDGALGVRKKGQRAEPQELLQKGALLSGNCEAECMRSRTPCSLTGASTRAPSRATEVPGTADENRACSALSFVSGRWNSPTPPSRSPSPAWGMTQRLDCEATIDEQMELREPPSLAPLEEGLPDATKDSLHESSAASASVLLMEKGPASTLAAGYSAGYVASASLAGLSTEVPSGLLNSVSRSVRSGCSKLSHEDIAAAAEAARARVEGPIGLAMRAKVLCRLAASQACRRVQRQLLMGRPDGAPPDGYVGRSVDSESYLDDEESEECSDEAASSYADTDSSYWEGEYLQPGYGGSPVGLAHHAARESEGNLHPAPLTDTGMRRRVQQVPQHTALGKMILDDPDRALKYNLVAVPSWTTNRPWPPPPLRVKRWLKGEGLLPFFRKGAEGVSKAVEEEEATGPQPDVEEVARNPVLDFLAPLGRRHQEVRVGKRRSTAGTSAAGGRLKPIVSVEGGRIEGPRTRRLKNLVKSVSRFSQAGEEHRRREQRDLFDGPDGVDFYAACSMVTERDIQAYRYVFRSLRDTPEGYLTRKGLQKAMEGVGLEASCAEDQRRLTAVQTQVLAHFRGDDEDALELRNPLEDPRGYWQEEEFVYMVVGNIYLTKKHNQAMAQKIADQHNMTCDQVEHLNEGFKTFAAGGNGLSHAQLRKWLSLVGLHPNDEDLRLLFQSVGLAQKTHLTFAQTVRVICKVEEFLPPGQKFTDIAAW